ncbi:MAG TPA: MraY family glycosyltransferase [Gemmatimonadaceae bacterium]|nr:MraY family glycosyltransferase [Gemmatimonadaceae bacterium]
MHADTKVYALVVAIAFALAIVLTRVVRNLATRFSVLDPCNDRSIHTEPLPRVGGVALFAALAASLAVAAIAFPAWWAELGREHYVLLGGAFAIHLLGLLDDLRPMRARYKLAGQLVIASGVYLAGLHIDAVLFPGGAVVELPWFLAMAATVIWLVGVTNAVNLIDGLDGLAAGTSVIALAAIFSVSLTFYQVGAALICCALAGSTLGFLRYNFQPATIFLGDSGSLVLGFMLAGLGIIGAEKFPGSVALFIPLVALGLPVIDTGVAIFRRHLRRHPIFLADRGHIHHRLIALGQSPRRVVLILYGFTVILGSAAIVLANFGVHVLFPLLIGFAALAFFLQWLRFDEFQELGLLVRRGFKSRDVISRNVRLREASTRIAELEDVREVLDVLETTFKQDGIRRAEIWLQRSFLNGKGLATPLPERIDDEIAIWAWASSHEVEASWWRVALPLLGPDDRRMGSFVVWEDGHAASESISYIQVISCHLKPELQRKFHQFEWAIAKAVNTDAIALDVDGIAVNAEGVAVADRILHIDHTAVKRVESRDGDDETAAIAVSLSAGMEG